MKKEEIAESHTTKDLSVASSLLLRHKANPMAIPKIINSASLTRTGMGPLRGRPEVRGIRNTNSQREWTGTNDNTTSARTAAKNPPAIGDSVPRSPRKIAMEHKMANERNQLRWVRGVAVGKVTRSTTPL